MSRILVGSAPICLPLLFAIVACVNSLNLGSTEQDSIVPLQNFDFGNVQVHVASPAHTFTISPASGVQSDQIKTITASCPDFAITAANLPATVSNTCIGAGSNCVGYTATTYTFTATFTPTVALPSSCVVTVGIDATTTTFTLSGTGTEPPVHETVSPTTTIDLGEVRIGDTSAAASVLVTNDGSGPQPLTITSVGFGATDAAFAVASGTTAQHDIAAQGGTDAYTVTCAPVASGPATGTLTIASNDPATPAATVMVTCTGVMSALEFLPASPALIEGAQPQKATRVGEPIDVPITLLNSGTASMMLDSLSLTGAQLTLAHQPAANTVLAVGDSANVVVHFAASAPVDQGTLGTLTVTHDDSQVRTINILGAALDTSMSISPDGAVDLGPVCAGKTATQPFYIVKNSAGTFKVNSISQPDAPFMLTGAIPSLGAPIAVDASAVTFQAVVAPTAAATLSSSFMITTDIPNAAPRVISLSAIGLPAGVTPTPSSLDLGSVSIGAMSAGQTVTLTNCGDAALTISQTQIVGADPDDFQIAVPPTSAQIAPGASAAFLIVVKPTQAGDLSATLQITYDTGSAAIALVGTGTGTVPDTRVPQDGTYYSCRAGGGDAAWPVAVIGLLVLRRRRRR